MKDFEQGDASEGRVRGFAFPSPVLHTLAWDLPILQPYFTRGRGLC